MGVDMSMIGRHVTAALTKQTWQIIHCQALVCSLVATASPCCVGQCRWVTCGSLDNQRGYCAGLGANTSWRDQSDSAHRDSPEDCARRTWSSFQHHLNTHTHKLVTVGEVSSSPIVQNTASSSCIYSCCPAPDTPDQWADWIFSCGL